MIHDDDCVVGLELLERRQPCGEDSGHAGGLASRLRGLFGVSGICNILGAIRMARYLDLGPEDNVVTIATDGFDRYPSVLANLEERMGPLPDRPDRRLVREDLPRRRQSRHPRRPAPRSRKNACSVTRKKSGNRFSYSRAYLDSMKSQSFWDDEFAKIHDIDSALLAARVG